MPSIVGLVPLLRAELVRLRADDGPPLHPDTQQARQWLADELAKAEYLDRPSLVERFLRWLRELMSGVTVDGAPSGFSWMRWLFVLGLLVVGGAILYAVLRPMTRSARLSGTRGRRGSVLDAGDTRSAAQLRQEARRAAAANQWDLAVLEGYRAVAQGAVERTILPDLLGRTAAELATGLTAAFPEEREPLRMAAASFDAVRYGDVRATATEAQHMIGLDARIATSRPDLAAVGFPR